MNWTPAEISEAQALYDQGRTPEQIARHFIRKRKARKLSSADVRPILDIHRRSSTTPELVAEIKRIRQTEWVSYRVIAARLGISRHIIERICVGMRPPKGASITCAKRTYTIQGQRNDLQKDGLIRPKGFEPVEVPAWVPDHLHEFYEHTAMTRGEEFAAYCARQLKRGQSVAHL
jgi:DNA-binding transcriptional regulator YiaG